MRSRRAARAGVAALGVALLAWLQGCGNDDPTGVGRDLRPPPDTLHVVELRGVFQDTVYSLPTTLASTPVGQLGSRFPYTTHLLYVFQIPTRVVDAADTLQLDEARLVLHTDSLTEAPYQGSMRIGILEVAAAERAWRVDSVMTRLPALEPDELASDTLVAGSALANSVVRLAFPLRLARVADYDTVRAQGDTLEVNVAVRFEGFAATGRGFLEIPFRDAGGAETAQLIGFSNEQTAAITTVNPARRRALVEFDGSYTPGTKLVASDGYRLHTYLKLDSLRTVLPDTALVHLAELVLTQVDSLDGTSFGSGGGPQIGVVVPQNTDSLFAPGTNARAIAFSATLAVLPGTEVSIPVTAYIFDIQEGSVPDRGMILRLSNEGTKARHFEFYGGAAPDTLLRPRLRIVYSLPAGFEGGER